MKKPLFERMGPAIELGRSFVCPAYQRNFAPLLLLWKGIAGFVSRHPHYRVLFGPVSISNDYAPVSRQLLVDYLDTVLLDKDLARLVKARKKPARDHAAWLKSDIAALGDIETLSALVAGVERDGKGVPVLLRQYLKLGGRILGFNVDPDFNDAIDALLMVDLARCEPRVLQRYMGKEEAQAYLERHRPRPAA
jgi:putative hemolysin